MAETKRDIRSLSHDELAELVKQAGQPAFRTGQVENWVWDKSATSFDQMTNVPKALRAFLEERLTMGSTTELVRQVSQDGSRKYLFGLADGAAVECVGMPTRDRLAVCVSSQAGCGMGCVFCATGAAGLTRSLTAEEIYSQVVHASNDFGMRATSVVLMGQGEPFANYDNVLKAMRMMNSPEGLGIGARHITVSTCGIIPMISRFANEPEQFTLALSLHSAVQKTRNDLMPGVRKYSLVHLYEVMGNYAQKTGRRPSYEYALIAGVNDTEDEIESLVAFCRGTLCHVNLIQLNDVPGSPLRPSPQRKVDEFVRRLRQAGVETTVRNSRGSDIDAACGQLRQRFKK